MCKWNLFIDQVDYCSVIIVFKMINLDIRDKNIHHAIFKPKLTKMASSVDNVVEYLEDVSYEG